jgi:hypothetical protein
VDVYSAANVLVDMGSIGTASDSRVTTFQHAYNAHSPQVQLVEDGKYGPMSEAALQSVLDYAASIGQAMDAPQAPANGFGPMGTEYTFPG